MWCCVCQNKQFSPVDTRDESSNFPFQWDSESIRGEYSYQSETVCLTMLNQYEGCKVWTNNYLLVNRKGSWDARTTTPTSGVRETAKQVNGPDGANTILGYRKASNKCQIINNNAFNSTSIYIILFITFTLIWIWMDLSWKEITKPLHFREMILSTRRESTYKMLIS